MAPFVGSLKKQYRFVGVLLASLLSVSIAISGGIAETGELTEAGFCFELEEFVLLNESQRETNSTCLVRKSGHGRPMACGTVLRRCQPSGETSEHSRRNGIGRPLTT